MSEGNPSKTEPWYRQRYLAEHWGRTMAVQHGLIIDEFRAAVTDAIKDLLATETFGPRSVLQALADVASKQKTVAARQAFEATVRRSARLKEFDGCPVCADAEKPDPASCSWHARYISVREEATSD